MTLESLLFAMSATSKAFQYSYKPLVPTTQWRRQVGERSAKTSAIAPVKLQTGFSPGEPLHLPGLETMI